MLKTTLGKNVIEEIKRLYLHSKLGNILMIDTDNTMTGQNIRSSLDFLLSLVHAVLLYLLFYHPRNLLTIILS